jgi:hypothetical protein
MADKDGSPYSKVTMDTKDLVSYLDELLFSKTGKHIDTLQMAILRGVLNGQKYAHIAQEYNCSEGHAKDEAYKLWRMLSDMLGENINKSNFRATIERITATNNNLFGNPIQIGKLNLCPNSSDLEENDDIIRDDQVIADAIQRKTKRETIPRLVKIGLTPEQIAEALELPIQEVKKILASLDI